MKDIIKVEAEWDVEDATFLTKKLYKDVAKGHIKFIVDAKPGSLFTTFSISVMSELIRSVAGSFLYDLIKTIYKRLKRDKELGREPKPVKVSNTVGTYTITGDKNSKLPEGLEYILREKIKD
jgi:hypothetical protein